MQPSPVNHTPHVFPHSRFDKEENLKQRRLQAERLLRNKHLFRYARQLCDNPEMAEDLVQEALLALLSPKHFIPPDLPLFEWACLFVRQSYSRIRRHEVKRVVLKNPEADVTTLLETRPSHDMGPFEELLQRELVRKIRLLHPHESEAMIEVGLMGLSYKEAAKKLGIAPGQAKSRYLRARTKVLAELQDP